MKRLLLLLVACKSSDTRPPPKPALGLAVEVRGAATLVTGTRRAALRTASSWFVTEGGKLVDKPEIAAAIAKVEGEAGGVVDVFLGTTPIVSGGEDHHEKHVRIAPASPGLAGPPSPIDVELHGVVAEVVTLGDREAWRFEHELRTQIAFITGTTVLEAPAIERIGPDAPEVSPVSKRLCRHPKIADLDASPTTAYALVTECSDDAPIRVVSYAGPEQHELRLPSRNELQIRSDVIAVSRSGHARLVGTRDTYLGIYRVEPDAEVTIHLDNISRVMSAVVADDDRLWILALDDNGYVLARDGVRFPLANPSGVALAPKQLGLDDTLGVVVLATGNGATWLFAERPGDPLTITPR